MDKKRLLLLGLVAGLVILGGIILSILLNQTVVAIGDGYVGNTTGADWSASVDMVSGRIWLFGLVYIIPGIIGFTAAFVQNKCMYVVTCILSMLSLLIMTLVVLLAGATLFMLILSVGNISEQCRDRDNSCMCLNQVGEYEQSPFKTCAGLEKIAALFIAVLVFIVLTWIGEMVEFVMACVFSCRSKSTTGGVILSSQQPMLHSSDSQGYPVKV